MTHRLPPANAPLNHKPHHQNSLPSPHLKTAILSYNDAAQHYNASEYADAEPLLNTAISIFLHHDESPARLKMSLTLLAKNYEKQCKYTEAALTQARLLLLCCRYEPHESKKWHYAWKTKLKMGKLDDEEVFGIIRMYVKAKYKARQHGQARLYSLRNVVQSEEKKFKPAQLFCTLGDTLRLNMLLDLEVICMLDIEDYYRERDAFHKEKQLIWRQLRDMLGEEYPIRMSAYEFEALMDEIAVKRDYLLVGAVKEMPKHDTPAAAFPTISLDDDLDTSVLNTSLHDLTLSPTTPSKGIARKATITSKTHSALLQLSTSSRKRKKVDTAPHHKKDKYLACISQNLRTLRQTNFAQDEHLQPYVATEVASLYIVRSLILYNRHISNNQFKYDARDPATNKPMTKDAYQQFIVQHIQDDLQTHLQELNTNVYKSILNNFLHAISSLERVLVKFERSSSPLWHYVRDVHVLSQYLNSIYYILDHFRQIDLQMRVLHLLKKLHYKDANQLLQINMDLSFLQIKVGNVVHARSVLESVQKKFFRGTITEETYTKYGDGHSVFLFRVLYQHVRAVEGLDSHASAVANLEALIEELKSATRASVHNKGHLFALSKHFMAEAYLEMADLHKALDCALSSLAYRSRATHGHSDLSKLLTQPLAQNNSLLTNNMDYHLMSLSLQQVVKINQLMGNLGHAEHYNVQGLILSLHTLSYSFLMDFMDSLASMFVQMRSFDKCAQFMEILSQFVQGFYSHAVDCHQQQQQKDDVFSLKQKVMFHAHFADYFLRQCCERGFVEAGDEKQEQVLEDHIVAHLKKSGSTLQKMKTLEMPMQRELKGRESCDSSRVELSVIEDKENCAPRTPNMGKDARNLSTNASPNYSTPNTGVLSQKLASKTSSKLANTLHHATSSTTLRHLRNIHLKETLFLHHQISVLNHLRLREFTRAERHLSKMRPHSMYDRAVMHLLNAQLAHMKKESEKARQHLSKSAKLVCLEIPLLSWRSYSFLSTILGAAAEQLDNMVMDDTTQLAAEFATLGLGLSMRHRKINTLGTLKKEIEKRKNASDDQQIINIATFVKNIQMDEALHKRQMEVWGMERQTQSQYKTQTQADVSSFALQTLNPSSIDNTHDATLISKVLSVLPSHFVVCSLALSPDFSHITAARIAPGDAEQSVQHFCISVQLPKSSLDSRFSKIVDRAYSAHELATSKYAYLVASSAHEDYLTTHVNTLYVALNELTKILSESNTLMANIDEHLTSHQKKVDWWKGMFLLDKRMQVLVSFMDTHLMPHKTKAALFARCQTNSKQTHFTLIFDRCLHRLPWEYTPVLRYDSCARMPSLMSLWAHLVEHFEGDAPKHEVDMNSLAYILNAGGDLTSSERRFQAYVVEEQAVLGYVQQWKGIVNRAPAPSEFESALQEHEVFLYMGHGSGEQYLSGDRIRAMNRAKLKVALLMGCSSGKLREQGEYEPEGVILDYLVSGSCGLIVANLWDVSAHECDRFTFHLLTSMLSTNASQKYVTHFVPAARETCRLRYLMGAAPVCYGVPLMMRMDADRMDLDTSGVEVEQV